jgi:hypothetical protein
VQQPYVCHLYLVLAASLVAEHSHGPVADLQAQISYTGSLHVLLLLLRCVPSLLLLLLLLLLGCVPSLLLLLDDSPRLLLHCVTCTSCQLLLLLLRRVHHCHMMQSAWCNNAGSSSPLGNQC